MTLSLLSLVGGIRVGQAAEPLPLENDDASWHRL